jgi:putative DNA primase/helicase
MVTVDKENIPERFKNRKRWLLWDKSNETPRRPHWKGNFGVSWTDAEDRHSFEAAYEAMQQQESWGIGYVFLSADDEYVIDIDGGYDESGEPRDWFPGLERFADAGAYMEWSPSGAGVHIPIEGPVPEFWSDCDVPGTEHQGVDVLENKFCTFTGDTLAESGESVSEVNAAPFLFHTYQNIEGESPRIEGKNRGQQTQHDELSKDEITDALSYVSESLDYTDWLKTGFAVYDWNSGKKGKRVFEQWSKSNAKWDKKDGQPHIDDIWENDSPNGKVTVATLISYAKEGGWTPPSPSKPEPPDSDGTPPADEPDSDTGTNEDRWWAYVQATYNQETNKEGRVAAADALEEETDWMYVMDSETLWVYDDTKGYFNSWGEQLAHRKLERKLNRHYSQQEANEIIGRLQARNQTRRKELNARTRDRRLLCVGNGVVDLGTGERHEHSPEYKFTRGLSWDYAPATANPEPIVEFLDDVTKREADRDTILDHLAHGLMPGHPYRALVIMYGPGSNGKTRVGKLFRGFVGEENAASVELQDLTGDDSFATGGLPGAFVNVGDDISVSEIRDTSIIKSLTGDGTVTANEKYEKQYEFENEAAMFFSANEPPRIRERTQAISDRLYPIEMPNRFVDDPDPDIPTEKEKVPGIAESLLDDDAAMRGLLVLTVKHAQEVIERNGQYSMPETPEQRRELYESASDPIKRFALTHMTPASGSSKVLKDDAFAVYQQMCSEENARPAGKETFKEQVGGIASIDLESTRTRALTPGKSRDSAWKYVEFAESATSLMPERLRERYFATEGETGGEDTDESDSVAYNATPLASAAETLTGYVTVTAEIVSVESFGERTTKAILKDKSGAMDFLAWDDATSTRLHNLEGETAVVQEAEVGEHDGTRQLQPVDKLTEIAEIQQGVGHTAHATPRATPESDTTDAATDGGETAEADTSPPADATGSKADARRLAQVFKREGVTAQETAVSEARAAGKAPKGMSPETVTEALEKGHEELGLFAKTGDGDYYLLD